MGKVSRYIEVTYIWLALAMISAQIFVNSYMWGSVKLEEVGTEKLGDSFTLEGISNKSSRVNLSHLLTLKVEPKQVNR